MIVFPNAKINIGLRIGSKRADGYHNLQSLFFPISLTDALECIPLADNTARSSFQVFDKEAQRLSIQNNTCEKAYQVLKKDFHEKISPVSTYLLKGIPHEAGLGGGSADGSFMLKMLNCIFSLSLSREQLMAYAAQIGSDCPFFIENTPAEVSGRGEHIQQVLLDLSSYQIMVVNPRISINTKLIFDKLATVGNINQHKPYYSPTSIPIPQWHQYILNDFEPIVFELYQEIKVIKDKIYQYGAVFALMSGTGSSVYGIFEKNKIPSIKFPANYFVSLT